MATDDIIKVKSAFNALLKNISKPRRRLLYQQIGRELARSQRRRITAQQNPDGSSYTPRKVQRKKRKGKIKQNAMFLKLKSARFMKLKTAGDNIELGYSGNDAQIAQIHQYGLKGRVVRSENWKVKYDQRELLGFTDEDIEMIENFVIKALADG